MKPIRSLFRNIELSPLPLALVILSPELLYPTLASATDVLDQSQTEVTYMIQVPPQQAQIFTATMYGTLDRVSLYLESNYQVGPPPGSVLTISVQTVIGGLPSGKQIGSGTIALSAIPAYGAPDWVDVRISGAVVHPNTQYALVVSVTSSSYVIMWSGYTTYAGGAMLFNKGTGWQTYDSTYFTFKTYVVPDTRDQFQPSAAVGLLTGGYGSPVGQTFTAAQSGTLDRVRVFLANYSLTGPVKAYIETVKGGLPSGTVIGQGSLPASSTPPWAGGWVTIGIEDAVVTAGTKYALVLDVGPGDGDYVWGYAYDSYAGGDMVVNNGSGWMVEKENCACAHNGTPDDAAFETYVAPFIATAPPPPPPPATITACSSGVCPGVMGSISPPDSTAQITSNVQFQELRDGRIHGVLHFDGSRTGNFVLQGCTTDSAACRLTVAMFACTDQHAITVAGTYTQKGETAGNYRLSLSGTRGGIGTFTLKAGDYAYSLTRDGIVDVTCPPVAGIVEGQR